MYYSDVTISARRSADPDRAVAFFHALSDATRLSIIEMLRDGERCVCELQDELDAAHSRLSFHLSVRDARQNRHGDACLWLRRRLLCLTWRR
jgi:DNA-binding transcriptional ArsR family regulator